MEDFGGITLSRSGLLGQVDLVRFLALAEVLANIVAAIHNRCIIHKDIHPGNILIRPIDSAHDRPDDLQAQIINFDLATTFAEEYPEFVHSSRILGTPAYFSPEQTGRMNRPVDYRCDLYSLGATLYALATGAPPFDGIDALSLVHAHLACSPVPPQQRAVWLPPLASELILALLAKEPDGRYQSAVGLAHDLRRLREALTINEPFEGLRLKQHDRPLLPRPPHRLYGRDTELKTLIAAFADVTEGGSKGVFVAGYAGVGKTLLINEIHRPVTLAHGLFIYGKFEQFQRDRPFLAPTQSLCQLCQLLLAEPDAAVARWRERILAGVGPEASALFDVVPEMEALLGPQPLASKLGPIESQVRLNILLVALLRQVASPAHPLVLFLDDLQWADQPSLDFIRFVLEEADLNGLLLIGAYRNNEVDASHPLSRLLRDPTASGQPAPVLTLSSLTVRDLTVLLGDMLHMPSSAVQPLADALYAKTGGNPFFTLEFLNMLYREGSLHPDPELGQWHWDVTAILMHPASANVLDFLAAQLALLSMETAETLMAVACLGNECELGILALATGDIAEVIVDRLAPALELGIIVTPSALAFSRADANAQIRFCHDRMAQAAYQLRDDVWRSQLHLAMARRFAQANDDTVCQSGCQFSAARHYALASHLITSTDERVTARRLFTNAAVQARQSGAFAAAERFLHLGINLLTSPPHEGCNRDARDIWQCDYESAFNLHSELHLVLYCLARHAEADEIYQLLAAKSSSPFDLLSPACIQIASLSTRKSFAEAVSLGCNLLAQYGTLVPLDKLPLALEEELEQFYTHLRCGALERMRDSPDIVDPKLLGVAKLMNRMGPAAMFGQPMLAHWLAVRVVRLWIEEGFCAAMLQQAAAMIPLTIMLRGDYVTGYRIACIAIATGSVREHGIETARARHVFSSIGSHWFQPLEEVLVDAVAARDELACSGNMELCCYTFRTTHIVTLEMCSNLVEMNVEITAGLSFAQKNGNRQAEEMFLVFRQLVRTLEGKATQLGSFDDINFSEQTYQVATRSNPMALCFFHTYRALAAFLFGEHETLTNHVEIVANLTSNFIGFYPTALANMLHSLALIQSMRITSKTERPTLLKRIMANQAWLSARAADAPMNFGHLYELIEAERLDALDRPWEAQSAYERAMCLAQAHQRPWHHALATERAGQFYMRRGLEHAGRPLLLRAHELYRQWGAIGKAGAMQENLPFLDTRHLASASANHVDTFEYKALLRASQVLATETSQPRLVEKVVELLAQLTGATDVRLLLLDDAGHWHLEGGLRGTERLERMALPEAEERRLVSTTGLRLAMKTLKPLVSEDAVFDSRFAGDPHFAGLPMCSLLALPIFVQGRITAFLALENRLFRAAFTTQGIETVFLLCEQLSISIENIKLYESLERKVADRTRELVAANRLLEALSITDGLTGIANRRCFDEALLVEWRRTARSCKPLALAILDVDWFKSYNDCYGHQAGDECLRKVAGVIQSHARRVGDLAARYGGEEFALIAPDTDLANMLSLAESIRTALESLALPHAESNYGRVTVSIGVAAMVPNDEPLPATLLRLADDAMYRAKAQGRNQTIAAEDNS